MDRNRKKVMFSLTYEAINAIDEHAPSKRKKGEWVNDLILDYVNNQNERANIPDVLQRMERQLGHIERRLERVESSVCGQTEAESYNRIG